MKYLRDEIIEFLINSLNTDQLINLARNFNPRFDIYRESGFEQKIDIPRKIAAQAILKFLDLEETILDFVAFVLSREGGGAGSGGIVHVRGRQKLFKALHDYNWIYNQKYNRFEKDQSRVRTSDWGILRENLTYSFAFASIDIVSSSQLIKVNEMAAINETMHNFKNFVQNIVEEWNGRVWNWSGDGGLSAFYGHDNIDHCISSMVEILAYLPYFNLTQNKLNIDSDIKIRIGGHYGLCNYQRDPSMLSCKDINTAHWIQENYAEPNNLIISHELHSRMRMDLQPLFREGDQHEGIQLYYYLME